MSDLSSTLGILLTILLLSSFAKIVTSLTILRVGLGLHQSGFGVVVIAVSLALSLFVMAPELAPVGGVNAVFNGKAFKQEVDIDKTFRPFLEKNSDPEITKRLLSFKKSPKQEEKPAADKGDKSKEALVKAVEPTKAIDSTVEVVMVSFLLSELKEAFQIGVIILIPFIVIDLLIANALVLLGINQLNPELLSLPFKIILFFAVDGWTLLAEKLLRTYI